MAKEEKKKRMAHTTGKAEAIFAHLVNPDYGTKEYPDEDGSFNITLRLSETEMEKLKAKCREELEEAQAEMEAKFAELPVATRKKLGKPTWVEPGAVEYERETEEATGNILVRFKTRATYKDRNGAVKKRLVPLFDSMLQPVSLKEEPGYGSIVSVSFTAVPYFVAGSGNGGITFYLNAVQILKLNKGGMRSAADYGFTAEELDDGFTGSENEDAGGVADTAGPASTVPDADEVPF